MKLVIPYFIDYTRSEKMEKLYKIIFTDYYFPNISKEVNQLKIIDCNDLIRGEVASEDQLLDHLQKCKAMDADAVLVNHAMVTSKFIKEELKLPIFLIIVLKK